ncbi:MAG TPA: PEP-CTERM sorting domain-containing protein [Tepidisphaeraceae bacterium]
MQRILSSLGALGLIALITAPASAALLSTPINTGVNDGGSVVGDGTSDGHYLVSSFGPPQVNSAVSGTPAPDALSAFVVSPTDAHAGAYGFFDQFSVADAGTMTISGQWATVDVASGIMLDGTNDATDVTPNPSTGWIPFTISAPVTAGTNALEFTVAQNFGDPVPAVRVEIFSVTPEPASIALLGGLAVALMRRR